MPTFIDTTSSGAEEQVSELVMRIFEQVASSPVFARRRENGFEVSDTAFDASCARIESIHVSKGAGPSLVAVENPVGDAPQIYVVYDDAAVLDEILTDAASSRGGGGASDG